MHTDVGLSTLRRLWEISARISAGREVRPTLQAVADGVVDGLGFGVAVVNFRLPDGVFEVVAVAGDSSARSVLLGRRTPPEEFAVEFARAEEWGRLRFVPHQAVLDEEPIGWIPPIRVPDDDDGWHPLDALFAPLTAANGDVVGILSVDLPASGRRPDALQRDLLELFAMQAGIAIDNARVAEQLEQQHRDLLRSEASFRAAFEGTGTGFAVVSLQPDDLGRLLRVNDALCRIMKRSREELLAGRAIDFLHPDDLDSGTAAVRQAAAGIVTSYRAERAYLRGDGEPAFVDLRATVLDPGEGVERFLLVQVDDITDLRAATRQLEHQAGHDPLTGLPNRRVLLPRISAAVERVRRTHRPGALLFLDLDGFKQINDRWGHAAGDAALQEVAARMQHEVRSRDLVARVGGDEFVILAEDVEPDDREQLERRIAEAVAAPLRSGGHRITVSIGSADLPESETDAETLLERADRAMYAGRTERRSG